MLLLPLSTSSAAAAVIRCFCCVCVTFLGIHLFLCCDYKGLFCFDSSCCCFSCAYLLTLLAAHFAVDFDMSASCAVVFIIINACSIFPNSFITCTGASVAAVGWLLFLYLYLLHKEHLLSLLFLHPRLNIVAHGMPVCRNIRCVLCVCCVCVLLLPTSCCCSTLSLQRISQQKKSVLSPLSMYCIWSLRDVVISCDEENIG